MQHYDVQYRGYEITYDGIEFVAESLIQDGELFQIGAPTLALAMEYVDEFLQMMSSIKNATNLETMPSWYRDWLDVPNGGRVHPHRQPA